MNEEFNTWLNGFINAISFTSIQMNYYWSSEDQSTHVIFSIDETNFEKIIPDEGFEFFIARTAVLEHFGTFISTVGTQKAE